MTHPAISVTMPTIAATNTENICIAQAMLLLQYLSIIPEITAIIAATPKIIIKILIESIVNFLRSL